MSRKEQIVATVQDAVSDFLYYDRKEDSLLPRGAIEEALKANEITVKDIVVAFETALIAGLRS
jgi:hypothetical protein